MNDEVILSIISRRKQAGLVFKKTVKLVTMGLSIHGKWLWKSLGMAWSEMTMRLRLMMFIQGMDIDGEDEDEDEEMEMESEDED